MSVTHCEKNEFERRAFPRFKAQCPLHYFTQDGGTWNEAVLEDYSAGGVCFFSNETLLQNTKITLQIMKNAGLNAGTPVPPMAASAIVVRCELDDEHRYKVACKLTRVRDDNIRRPDYLRR